MRVTDFSFELSESLIAHYPMPEHSNCRLLSLDGPTGTLTHGIFTDPLNRLNLGDLLVFDNTCVTPARLFGRKTSGGEIEALVERVLDDKRILVHIHALKAPKPGVELLLGDNGSINTTMTARYDALLEVGFNDQRSVLGILSNIGHMPSSLYTDRPDEDADCKLYQTIYSEKLGVIATPTAGLHFDEPLLEKLRVKGVKMAFVTLYVGADTFQPVHIDTIEDHIIHSKYVGMLQDVVDAVLAAKARDNRVIAVGTASAHSPESAAQATKNDPIGSLFDDTQIFIYPGFQYKVVDALVTNFHLPESTLIMLVPAFTDYQHITNVYEAAVEEKYRFFSYGGTMFITYNPQAINECVREQFRSAGLSIGPFS